jgi:predicted HD phosphohydrolase
MVFKSVINVCKRGRAKVISKCYKKYGGYNYIQHALQTGTLLRNMGACNNTVSSGFLHDFGYICQYIPPDVLESSFFNNPGYILPTMERNSIGQIVNHGSYGASVLWKMGCNSETCNLISSQLDAERYSATIDLPYARMLSDFSTRKLVEKGGLMSTHEVEKFESLPYFLKIKLLQMSKDTRLDNDDCLMIEDMEEIISKCFQSI